MKNPSQYININATTSKICSECASKKIYIFSSTPQSYQPTTKIVEGLASNKSSIHFK